MFPCTEVLYFIAEVSQWILRRGKIFTPPGAVFPAKTFSEWQSQLLDFINWNLKQSGHFKTSSISHYNQYT